METVNRKLHTFWIAILGILLALPPACGTDSQPTSPRDRSESVIIGMLREPANLNPYLTTGGWEASTVADALFDSWLIVDDEGRLHPQLLKRVPSERNGDIAIVGNRLHLRLLINPLASWSDDTPVTCDDFVFTWQTVLSPRWKIASRRGWEEITTVRCPDPYTINVRFRSIYAPYTNLLRAPPLPAHHLQASNINTKWQKGVTVTSGPFSLASWQRGIQISLRRDTGYWRAPLLHTIRPPSPDRIVQSLSFRFFQGENARNLQYATGQVSLIQRQLADALVGERALSKHDEVATRPALSVTALAFQHDSVGTDTRNVRLAIAASIDRALLVRQVLRKPFRVASSTFSSANSQWMLPQWTQRAVMTADIDSLMSAAGFHKVDGIWGRNGTPLRLRLVASDDRGFQMRSALFVQAQLRAHGFDVMIVSQAPAIFYGQTMVGGTYSLALLDIGSGLDPDQRGLFACDPSRDFNNPFRYCNAQVSEMLDRSQHTIGKAQRTQLVHHIQRLMFRDMAILPLYENNVELLADKALHGPVPNAFAPPLWNVEMWEVRS